MAVFLKIQTFWDVTFRKVLVGSTSWLGRPNFVRLGVNRAMLFRMPIFWNVRVCRWVSEWLATFRKNVLHLSSEIRVMHSTKDKIPHHRTPES
jgi:hypothetical protein